MLNGYKLTLNKAFKTKMMNWMALRSISSRKFAHPIVRLFLNLLTTLLIFYHLEAQHKSSTNQVTLRGKYISGSSLDLPNLIWLPDLFDHAENFESFFTHADNKVKKVRNIHLLNHRNFGHSDHHDTIDLNDMANDVVRYMDDHNITMATIGGHGFGAKVAIAAASQNLDRFTGVM